MSSRLLSAGALTVLVFSCVITLLSSTLYADDCTLVGNQLSCNALFTTSGQSMFGFGQSEAIYHQTFGTSWNTGGSAGGIWHPTLFGASLGYYGAEVHASTSGNVGLTLDFRANGGTVNAWAPAGVTLNLPNTSQMYHPGDLITIGSTYNPTALTSQNFGFSTQSPTLAASAQFGFRMAANVGATVCVVGCTGFNLGFDTKQQTIPIFSYNEALNGTGRNDISINNSGLSIFGKSISGGTYSGDISRLVGLPANTWTVNADITNKATMVQATSGYNGSLGIASAKGQADNPLVSTTLDVAKVLTNVGGIALSSGSLGDLLPPKTPDIVKDIADLVDYNLVTADVGLGLKLGQNFSMNAPTGAQVTLNMKAGDVTLPSMTFQAGQSAQFAMPDALCTASGCSISDLTITPEITISGLGFSSTTSLDPQLMLTLQALGLSFAGLDIGPLVNWNKDFNLGTLSMFSNNFTLGGFNTITAPSFTLTESIPTFGTGDIIRGDGMETVSYNYRNVGAAGLVLNNEGPQVWEEHLVGAILRPDPDSGLTRASVTMGNSSKLSLDQSSTVTSMDITASGVSVGGTIPKIESNGGANKIENSTIAANNSLQLNVGAHGSLTIKDSAVTDLQDLYVATDFNNGVWSYGELVLDHSTLTQNGGYPSIDGKLLLVNGSNATINGQFYLYNFGFGIDIMSGSTLTSNWIKSGTFNYPGNFPSVSAINIGENSTLNARTLEKGQLNINGGTANVTNLFGVDEVNINNGTLAFQGGGDTQNTMGSIHLNGGLISFDGDQTTLFTPISGTGELRVSAGGSMLMDFADMYGNRYDTYLGTGSQLNVAGRLTDVGHNLHAAGATANVSGSLFLGHVTVELEQLNITQGGDIAMMGGSSQWYTGTAATISKVKNNGTLQFIGGTVGPATLITNEFVNTGTILIGQEGSTPTPTLAYIDVPTLENNGGKVNVLASTSLTLSGHYVQQDGSTMVKGTLSAPDLTLNGGSLSGSGTVMGAVKNVAGIVQPGNSPGTLTINGSFMQGVNGLLDIQIDSLADFDRLIVNGDASLNGTVKFDITSALFSTLTIGDSFDFLSVLNGNLTGIFSQVQFDYIGGDLPFGYGWDLVYGSNGVDLIWSQAKDYGPLGIAINEGSPLPTTFGDLPTTGLPPEMVGIILQSNPGMTTDDLGHVTVGPSDYTGPSYTVEPKVPEPSSWLLLAAGLALGIGSLRRR